MTGKKPSDLEQGEQSALLTSPPPYTPVASASGAQSQNVPPASNVEQQSHQQPSSNYSIPPLFPTNPSSNSQPRSYPTGPTAFSSLPVHQTTLYQHQRALAQADRRARRRMCSAICYAFILYLLIGAVVGGIVGEEVGRRWDDNGNRRRGGHHRHEGDVRTNGDVVESSVNEIFATI